MKNRILDLKIFLIYIIPFIIFLLVGARGILTEPSQAVQALEIQGYSSIEIVDKSWLVVGLRGCGYDAARYTANAMNPAGKKVQVFVCVGWPFKGATIRTP